MKKIWISIWLVSYLALSIGVSVNLHYCMNRLASTELYASATDKCPKCGMHINKSSGCCRDEVKIVKMDNDQQFSGAVQFITDAPVLELPPTIHPDLQLAYFDASPVHASIHGPPLRSIPDLNILHAVFRI